MPTNFRLNTVVIAAAALLALGACSRDDSRTAGEKLDAGIAKTEQSAAEAKAEIKQETAEAKATIKQEAAEVKADASAAAERANQAVSNAAGKAGNAIGEMSEKVADTVSDAGITASVNAELAKDTSLSALRINVDTVNGRVLLRGTAPSSLARDRATTLARAVKGVSAVDNQLEVRG